MKIVICLAISFITFGLSAQIVLPKNSTVTDFHDGYATIKSNGNYALIDPTLNQFIPYKTFDFISTPFASNVIVLQNGKAGIYNFMNESYSVRLEYDAITLPDQFGNVLLSKKEGFYRIYNIYTNSLITPLESILTNANTECIINPDDWNDKAFIVSNTNNPKDIQKFKYITNSISQNTFIGTDINSQTTINTYNNQQWSITNIIGQPVVEGFWFEGEYFLITECNLPDGNIESQLVILENNIPKYSTPEFVPELLNIQSIILKNDKEEYTLNSVMHRNSISYYKIQLNPNGEEIIMEPKYRTMYGPSIPNAIFIPLNAKFQYLTDSNQYITYPDSALKNCFGNQTIYAVLGVFDQTSNLAYAEVVEGEETKKGFIDKSGTWKLEYSKQQLQLSPQKKSQKEHCLMTKIRNKYYSLILPLRCTCRSAAG